MVAKNLFANSLFWSIISAMAISIVPAVQKVRSEKQLPTDAILTIVMASGLAIRTVNDLYKSSGSIYYTDKRLPGINVEDAERMAGLNDENSIDGNF